MRNNTTRASEFEIDIPTNLNMCPMFCTYKACSALPSPRLSGPTSLEWEFDLLVICGTSSCTFDLCGFTLGTYEVAATLVGNRQGMASVVKVSLINKPNGGKSKALNAEPVRD